MSSFSSLFSLYPCHPCYQWSKCARFTGQHALNTACGLRPVQAPMGPLSIDDSSDWANSLDFAGSTADIFSVKINSGAVGLNRAFHPLQRNALR